MSSTVQVSVVMPTYNRLHQLKLVLVALAHQSFPSDCFEVIVVSDGSTDGTNEYLQEIEPTYQLITVFQHNAGPAEARNQGAQLARGDIILFLDDDVVPAPNLIAEHLAGHEQFSTKDSVVIGPMLSPANFALAPWIKWMHDRLNEQYQAMHSGKWQATARQFYTGNASLSRHLFLKHDGFDVSLRRAEDVELAFRLAKSGVKFSFRPEAAGYHYEQRSFASWIGIAYTYGRTDILFARQLGQDWILPTLIREFKDRNSLVKGLVRLCLDRRHFVAIVTQIMKVLAEFGAKFRLTTISRMACSIMFNLHYYQGIAGGLGGRQQFFAAARNGIGLHDFKA